MRFSQTARDWEDHSNYLFGFWGLCRMLRLLPPSPPPLPERIYFKNRALLCISRCLSDFKVDTFCDLKEILTTTSVLTNALVPTIRV